VQNRKNLTLPNLHLSAHIVSTTQPLLIRGPTHHNFFRIFQKVRTSASEEPSFSLFAKCSQWTNSLPLTAVCGHLLWTDHILNASKH